MSSSKKRKKDGNAEAPKQSGGVELHLDDILAAEVCSIHFNKTE